MRRATLGLLVLALLGAAAAAGSQVAFNGGLVNKRVVRLLDLRTHVEEALYQVEIENAGTSSTDYYIWAVAGKKVAHLSHVAASTESKVLKVERVGGVSGLSGAPADAAYFKIALPAPLAPKASVKVQVATAFTRTIRPFPAEMGQTSDKEGHLVLFEDGAHVLSVYPSKEQITQARLGAEGKKIKSTTPRGRENGDTIEWGPFEDVAALSNGPALSVHYENASPFATMLSAKKLIEVSHWGNINVEEHFVLANTGAKLSGGFSRYEYQRNQKLGNSFRFLTAILPASASDLYYRDQIGNISTSHVRLSADGTRTEWEVLPRFPMFGGWQTDLYMGYNVPASEFLSVDAADSSRYVLNITFGAAFPQAAIDDLEVRVILPEFASDIQFVTPFEVDSASEGVHVTYLDTVGRPVVVINKRNLMRFHDQPFQVVYRFSSTMMLQEPLLIVAAVFLFFLSSMVLSRLELSLSDDKAAGVLRSKRDGRLGEAINRVLAAAPALLEQVAQQSDVSLKEAEAQHTQLKVELDDIKKEVVAGDAAERLDKAIGGARAAAVKALKQADAESKAKLAERLAETKRILGELAAL